MPCDTPLSSRRAESARRRVAVRADSSATIGHGHVMRCLALAAVLRERGCDLTFLHRPAPGDASAAIVAAGFALQALAPGERPAADDPRHPRSESDEQSGRSRFALDASAAADAEASAAILRDLGGVDWLLLDHYGLGADWVRDLGAAAHRVLVVDDLADRPLAGDLLLDPNWHEAPAERYRHRWPHAEDPASLLLGTTHALLRPEFAAHRATLARRDGRLRRIVIAFGGGDPANATGACVEALHTALPALLLDVLVGSGSPHGSALRERWSGNRQVVVTIGAQDVAERFAQADLFVGAGGSMTWERACLGLPGVTLPIAANQLDGCARLAAAGEGVDLGLCGPQALARLVPAVQSLAAAPEHLQAMALALARRCDGHGAERVADVLLACIKPV